MQPAATAVPALQAFPGYMSQSFSLYDAVSAAVNEESFVRSASSAAEVS